MRDPARNRNHGRGGARPLGPPDPLQTLFADGQEGFLSENQWMFNAFGFANPANPAPPGFICRRLLDERFGMALGDDLITNARFDGLGNWLLNTGVIAKVGESSVAVTRVSSANDRLMQQMSGLTAGQLLMGFLEYRGGDSGWDVRLAENNNFLLNFFGGNSAVMPSQDRITLANVPGPTVLVGLGATGNGLTANYSRMSFFTPPGNHCVQASAASSPMVENGTNLGQKILTGDGTKSMPIQLPAGTYYGAVCAADGEITWLDATENPDNVFLVDGQAAIILRDSAFSARESRQIMRNWQRFK